MDAETLLTGAAVLIVAGIGLWISLTFFSPDVSHDAKYEAFIACLDSGRDDCEEDSPS